ncbi:Ctf8-domain-containing protein [Lactarius sanguifluus]|nr:Ctf8-domain-containing protein [Lactarius sanguifluus]
MIVPLTLSSDPSSGARTLPPALAQLGSSELFLLELQGDLEVSGDKRSQLVGHLTIDDSGKGKPTLRIGYHLLEGTIVSLAKPLAVLQRVPTPSRSHIPPPPQPDEDISMLCGDNGGEELGALGEGTASTAAAVAATSYTIRTLVRKKIVFSKRPTPIVGASAKIVVPAPL